MTSSPGLLRIGLFNTRSVCNKLHHVAETLNEFDLDILCLTETWLFPSDIDIVRAALPKSHSIAHVPRTTTTGAPGGGGVLIYSLAISNIKHGMPAFQASSFELMGAFFSCHRQTISIYPCILFITQAIQVQTVPSWKNLAPFLMAFCWLEGTV